MKKVIVFGNTTLSKMLFYDSASSSNFAIACFTVDKTYLQHTEFLGLPLIDFEQIEHLYSPKEYDMLAVLDGFRGVREREKLYLKAKNKGYTLRNYISPKADFSPEITMGENNIILSGSHVGIGGTMSNNNLIRQNVYLGHHFILGNNNVFAPSCNIGGNCEINNACYFGLGSTVLNNLKIADETLIGAGSVVIRNTEPYSKNVGNPSSIIGYHQEEGVKMTVREQ